MGIPVGIFLGYFMGYTLQQTNITMENHNVYYVNQL